MNRDVLLEAKDLIIGHGQPLGLALNFKICQDDLILISGKNGSGKSTLIKTLLGELKPLAGAVKRAGKLQALPQHHQGKFLLPLTVGEIAELYKVELNSESLFPLQRIKLKWSELSGGMKQRLLLDLLTAKRPDILILDEPANHLDLEGKKDFAAAIDSLFHHQRLQALILISHIPLQHTHPITKRIEL